jgi:hypothetical protein
VKSEIYKVCEQMIYVNSVIKRSGSGVVSKKEGVACERLNLEHELLALRTGFKFGKKDCQSGLIFN